MNSSACTLILLDMQLYKYLDFLYMPMLDRRMTFPVHFCFTLEFLLPINYPCESATRFCQLPGFAARIYPRG